MYDTTTAAFILWLAHVLPSVGTYNLLYTGGDHPPRKYGNIVIEFKEGQENVRSLGRITEKLWKSVSKGRPVDGLTFSVLDEVEVLRVMSLDSE